MRRDRKWMKIVCIIGALAFGGAERVMTNLVNFFSDECDVTYIAIGHRDIPAYNISGKVKFINGIEYSNKLKAVPKLRSVILKEKPDIALSFLTLNNILTLLALLGTDIPVVISERGDPGRNTSFFRKMLRKVTYPWAKGYVFQTEDAKKFFSSKIQKKSAVIPNPVSLEKEYADYKCTNPDKIIYAVGRLEKQKNYDLMISAFKRASNTLSDYRLVIYGDGSEKTRLGEKIREIGLEDRIQLCGSVNNVHDCIKDGAAYILTSDFEGMPNSLMEAMAIGLCCISSDCPVGGPRMLIENGKNGFLFPTGDEDELVKIMENVITDRGCCAKIGTEAKKIYFDYNEEIINRRWFNYLMDVLEKQNE